MLKSEIASMGWQDGEIAVGICGLDDVYIEFRRDGKAGQLRLSTQEAAGLVALVSLAMQGLLTAQNRVGRMIHAIWDEEGEDPH